MLYNLAMFRKNIDMKTSEVTGRYNDERLEKRGLP